MCAAVLALVACGGRSSLRAGSGPDGGATGGGEGGGGGAGGESSCVTAVLGTDPDGAQFVTLSASDAFWTTSDGLVMQAPLAGGPATALYQSPTSALGVAVDGGHVYWAETTRVMRALLPDGTPEVVAEGQTEPLFVAARGEACWWLSVGAGVFAGEIVHRREDGTIETLVTGIDAGRFMRIDATHAYFTAEALLVPGSSLYGVLARAPLEGGPVEPLVIGLHMPSALALAGDHVYWLEQLGLSLELAGSLYERSKAGGATSLISQIPGRLALGLAVDVSDAFVTTYSSTSAPTAILHRVPLDGATPASLATFDGEALYGDVAVDAEAVVWTANWNPGNVPPGTPSVRKLCK